LRRYIIYSPIFLVSNFFLSSISYIHILLYQRPRTTIAPDTLSLAGKTALITGSGRENGVGAAIARGFARNGAAVAIHYVSEGSKPRAEKVAASIANEFGAKTTVVHGSVSDYKTTREMVSGVLKGLDVDHINILGKLYVN
jgi:hypothetical protein